MLSSVHSDTKEKEEEQTEAPLFSIGLIADTQYADADTGQNYTKTRTRRYRQALQITQNAVKVWNDESKCIGNVRPSLIMHLGDVIDLQNAGKKKSVSAMNAVMMEFDKFKPLKSDQLLASTKHKELPPQKEDKVPFGASAKYPFYHNCNGNHEVYNFDRRELQKYQYCAAYDKQRDEYQYYHSFRPFDGFLFIVLDAFVLSTHGYEYTHNQHPYYKQAMQLLNTHNPHENKNIPPTPTAKSDVDVPRYTAFNGGFGEKQLKWLENELRIAEQKQEKVFIFSHIPLMSSWSYDILAWDYKACKQLIEQHANVVKGYFAGHEHDGDMQVINGIFHRTLEGAIESGQNVDCFATVYFFERKIQIQGYGKIKDEVFEF